MSLLTLLRVLRNVRALLAGLVGAVVTFAFFCLLQVFGGDAFRCLSSSEPLTSLGLPAMGAATAAGNALSDLGHTFSNAFGNGGALDAPAVLRPALLSFLVASVLAVVASALLSSRGKIDFAAMFGGLLSGAAATILGLVALWLLVAYVGFTVTGALVTALVLGVVANVFVFGRLTKDV